nr:SIR2 family protein [Stenotrophomonas geniculata]
MDGEIWEGALMPNAATITIRETLELLDGPYAGVSAGVSEGAYGFWLGSGISRDRIVGLDGVLAKLLEFLRSHEAGAPGCPYHDALTTIINMAAPNAGERALINYATPVNSWGCLPDLLKRLWKQYAAVLSVPFGNERSDYLIWEGLDFAHTFAGQEADAEHLAIGMLALEGAVTELASANWDGLLEAAIEELGHGSNFYRITVTGEDLRQGAANATLYKFHGCALRAIEHEDTYRPLIVARSAQISGWNTNQKFKIVRDQLSAVVQRQRTLMIGLSAQDANIKHLFAAANQQQGWQWNAQPAPIVISAQDLENDQRELLSLVYQEDVYEAHRQDICESARLQAFAKPLLLALLLQVMARKLEVLASDVNAPNLDPTAREAFSVGIRRLRDRAAEAGNDDRAKFARAIAATSARALHQLRDGNSPAGGQIYYPLDVQPAHLMKGKLALKSTGQREAAAGLGLIGLGEASEAWAVSLDDPFDSRSGALRLVSQQSSARVFFAADDDKITSLLESGAFDEEEGDVVIICSGRISTRQQRSPRGGWRDGNVGPRYLPLGPMLYEINNIDELQERFRGEIGL